MKDLTKYWFGFALFFFFITALAGLTLRWLPLQNFIDNSYYFGILQSHSHTGFLGWIYIALYILILRSFGRSSILNLRKTNIILAILSFLLLAMYISFPFDNYGAFSITFLSLFLIFSYYSLVYLYKNIDSAYKNNISKKFILIAIIFYFISSISPWLLGPIIAMGYKKTALYYNNIFFYLHFLYNGYIFFAIAGLFLKDIEDKNISKELNIKLRRVLLLLTTGTVLNYSESLLWNKPPVYMHIIAFLSSVLIFWALIIIFKISIKTKIHFPGITKVIFSVVIFSLLLKSILHFFQSIPYFSRISYEFKGQFIIGYIHLITLGLFSLFVIAYSLKHNLLKTSKTFNTGILIFISGFIATELLLFGQGILLWNNMGILLQLYNPLLFYFSLLMFLGISIIMISYSTTKKENLPA